MNGEIIVVAALAISLLTIALVVAAVGNLRANARTRQLMASYDEALAAKDDQIATYERLIAAQEGCLQGQEKLIRHHEEQVLLLARQTSGAA